VSQNDNAVSSTAGTLLPANWIEVFRCSPGQRVSAISNDAGTFANYGADRLMDRDWTKTLTPAEAQAALEAFNASKAPITAREAAELLKLKRALETKAEAR
jgi:hypothetical protein